MGKRKEGTRTRGLQGKKECEERKQERREEKRIQSLEEGEMDGGLMSAVLVWTCD